MRKTYIIPSIIVVRMQTVHMMAGSVSSDKGIDYGGKVGEDDNITPEVKESKNIWDENW